MYVHCELASHAWLELGRSTHRACAAVQLCIVVSLLVIAQPGAVWCTVQL